jgi:hypothetical protein
MVILQKMPSDEILVLVLRAVYPQGLMRLHLARRSVMCKNLRCNFYAPMLHWCNLSAPIIWFAI